MAPSRLYTTCKHLLFMFFVFIVVSTTAQVISEPQNIWIKPTEEVQLIETAFIGNYNTLNLADESIQQRMKEIGDYTGGTLFLVGQFPQRQSLIQIGHIVIGNHEARAGQNILSYDSLGPEPTILKLAYSISPKYKKPELPFFIDEDVQLAEIIFFDHGLTDEASRKVESYLALKYSINITKNTDNEKRHYINPDDQRVWDYPFDRLYEEEVLGLGRVDDLELYQTQTYAADAAGIRLSFSTDAAIGDMPEMNMADESLLVLSKKMEQEVTSLCGASSSYQPWKLHFHKWSAQNPSVAYLWLDSAYVFENPPLLTNGNEAMVLNHQQMGGGTQFTLPLSGLDVTQDYYIVFEPIQVCDPLAQFEVMHCEDQPEATNAIKLHVNDEGLDAQIALINRSTGEQFNFEMDQPHGTISPVAAGQYQLILTHQGTILMEKVFRMHACQGNMGSVGSPQFNQFTDHAQANTNHQSTTRKHYCLSKPHSENAEKLPSSSRVLKIPILIFRSQTETAALPEQIDTVQRPIKMCIPAHSMSPECTTLPSPQPALPK
jgi:hypothetical protein